MFETKQFDVTECMPLSGALYSYVQFAQLQASNGSRIYHLGSAIPILLNELNLRGYYVAEMSDQGKSRPFTVLSLLLGRSGDGKSTSAATAIHHICGLFDREEDEFSVRRLARKLDFEGTIEGIRYALATDHYVENLNATIALLYQEELTTVFQRTTSTIPEFLLRLYDGREIAEHQRQHQRAKEEGTETHGTIRNPKINALFCSTHDNFVRVVSRTMASGGLYGRLLVFTGEDRIQPYEGDIVGNQELLQKRNQWEQISSAELTAWSEFLEIKRPFCHGAIQISAEGHEVFRERHAAYQKLINRGALDDNLCAMLGRASRTAWMIAALYATSQLRLEVSADDARRATQLVDHCFAMGETLNRLFDQTDFARRQGCVIQALEKAGAEGLTLSEVYAVPGLGRRGIKKMEMHEVLETLVEAGTVVKLSQKTNKRGRPGTVFYLPQYVPSSLTAN